MKKVFEKTYALSTDELGDIIGQHLVRREGLVKDGRYNMRMIVEVDVVLVTLERFEDEEPPPAAMVLD